MRNDSTGVSSLKEEGKTITNPKEKANALNRQFEAVFTRESDIPPQELSRKQQYPDITNLKINATGVKKLLTKLKANKAAGPDGIRPVVLKELADEVSPFLTNIFKVSIETGSIPQDWKEAYVTSCQLSSQITDLYCLQNLRTYQQPYNEACQPTRLFVQKAIWLQEQTIMPSQITPHDIK